jgi:hypothetical protein
VLRLVLGAVVAVERLGLGRAALHQERGEQHVAAHLQELRLPVLEQRLGEVPVPR